MKGSNLLKRLAIVIEFILLFQYVNIFIPLFHVSAVTEIAENDMSPQNYSIEQIEQSFEENENVKGQDSEQSTQLEKYKYVDKNGNIYYIHSDEQTENNDNNISITKDESELNLDKVYIKVQVPENTYTTILPDGNSSIDSNIIFEATKNGEYVFEFTDNIGNSQMRVVHVTNIQNRKETKVPKVTATNKIVKLESDKEIEYSLDKKRWEDYTKEIEYKEPLYARVKDENYECSTIKITINENGELKVENTEEREVEPEILTNGIGQVTSKLINYQSDVEEKSSISEEEKKSLFKYISKIDDGMKYNFSSTDGEYEEINFENNAAQLTYKDLNNNNVSIDDENLNIHKISNSNSNIDYSIIYKQYKEVPLDESSEENENKKLENGEIYAYEKILQGEDSYIWNETYVKYAYIDGEGNLNSNIDIINIAKQEIEKSKTNIKYTKLVGDGVTFYILTEDGTVYMLSSGDNGTYEYFENILGSEYKSELKQEGDTKYIILKLNLKNIINIYDSCTALTKDEKIVSLLQDNEEDTSVVQELQKQIDKYLIESHLGLKDGKLYNFANVKEAVEVTGGTIVKSDEAKFGIYSENNKTIKLFKNENEKQVELLDGEYYIDVQANYATLPEFADIAEHRNSYLAMFVSRIYK